MPARKMRVEVFDADGNRYTVAFEGHVTKDKALRLLDIVELLGGMPEAGSELNQRNTELSKFEKIRRIVEKNFPIVWFSSRDVQSSYEQILKEPIGLSTVSTYLSRMANRGILAREEMSNCRRYKIMTEISRRTLTSMKGNK